MYLIAGQNRRPEYIQPRILRHASILSGKKSIFTFGNHPSMKIMAEQEMVTHVVRHDAGSVEHHLGPQVESEIRALTWP